MGHRGCQETQASSLELKSKRMMPKALSLRLPIRRRYRSVLQYLLFHVIGARKRQPFESGICHTAMTVAVVVILSILLQVTNDGETSK